MENENKKACLVCQTDQSEVPVLEITYQDKKYYICPQHMPVLIHNPDQLKGMLPNADNLTAG